MVQDASHEAKEVHRKDRSDRFAHEFGRLLDVPTSAVIKAMETLPSREREGQPELFRMAAPETARLICACLAERSEMSAVAVADRFLTMEFQCEIGPEATTDSRWHPARRDPRKNFFGTKLSAVLESAGSRDDDRTGLSPAMRAALSLGWTPNGEALGLLQFDRPQRRATLLYSSAPLFTRLDAGIRIGDLELDFKVRLNFGADRLKHLACVMRDLGGSEAGAPTTTPYFLEDAEATMWREGWGFWRAPEDHYLIGRIDSDRRFAGDEEAIAHVASLAAMGEPLHQFAIGFHFTRASSELGSAPPL